MGREYTTTINKVQQQDWSDGPARLAAMLMVEENGVLRYRRVILALKVLLEDLGVRSRRFYKLFIILLHSL